MFVVLFYLLPLYYVGLEFLMLPIMLIILIAGIIGIITLPLTGYKLYKRKQYRNWLNWTNGLALGAYLGYLLTMPILDWNEEQRDYSGKIISEQLEKFRMAKGRYPDELSDLQMVELNEKLPKTYQLDRFNYILTNDEYDLYIPIPITDRWQWNKTERKWDYR